MTGEEYRTNRLAIDLTQQQLAEKLGVAVSTIQAREQAPEKEVGSEAVRALRSVVAEVALAEHEAE